MSRSFFNVTKNIWLRIHRHDIFGLAAQLAYFFLLSLFPLLIFLITLLPYLPLSVQDILNFIAFYAPEDTMKFIETNINQLLNRNDKLLSFGIIATIWSASNGINAIIISFNKAYEVKETRSFILARGMSIFLTFAMIIVFVVALLLPVFGKELGMMLFSFFNLSDQFLAMWGAIRWFFSAIILFIVFIGLYWFAPNIKMKCMSAVPGAIFATVGWILASFAFAKYVNNFGNYSYTYGSIGAVIVLMIWFYITGIIIMIGGEINAYYSKEKDPTC